MSYPPPPGAGAPGGFPPPGGGYPPPGGGFQGGGYPPPQAQQTNGLAIASLVIGIIGILSCVVPPIGLVALILGVLGLNKAKQLNGSGKGLAIGGIVTGIVGMVAGTALFVIFFVVAESADNVLDDALCEVEETTLETAVSSYRSIEQADPASQDDLVREGYLSSRVNEYDFEINDGVVTVTAVDGQGCS
jgi:hypothetical protein